MSGATLEKALEAVRKLIHELSKKYRIREAYVFGSYVKGTWISTSDIDIIIVSEDFRGINYLKRLDIVYETAWKLKLRPHTEVIPLTPEEFEEKKNTSAVIRDAMKYWVRIA